MSFKLTHSLPEHPREALSGEAPNPADRGRGGRRSHRRDLLDGHLQLHRQYGALLRGGEERRHLPCLPASGVDGARRRIYSRKDFLGRAYFVFLNTYRYQSDTVFSLLV